MSEMIGRMRAVGFERYGGPEMMKAVELPRPAFGRGEMRGRLVPSDAGDAAALRGCPFCGAAPALEPHPRFGEAVRIACVAAACAVRPATEFLLREYVEELRAAWNARPHAEEAGATRAAPIS